MRFVDTAEDFENWCEANGYTKDDLAEILGVTRQTIYNWTHRRPYNPQGKVSEEVRADLQAQDRRYGLHPVPKTPS